MRIISNKQRKRIRNILLLTIFHLFYLSIIIYLYSNYQRATTELKNRFIPTTVDYRIDTLKIPVTITVYNPTPGQCDATPFVTSDGSTIDPTNPRRWIGVSRDILEKTGYATIFLKSNDCPFIDGSWEIHDTGPATARNSRVDVLVSNPHVVHFGGKWEGFLYKLDTVHTKAKPDYDLMKKHSK